MRPAVTNPTDLTTPLANTRRRLSETVTEDRHMRKFLIVAALLFMAVAPAQSAAMQCGDRASLLKVLSNKYKESPRALGLSTTGKAMFEIYTSDTGTWTIVMTTTAGLTCLMAAGHSWQEIEAVTGEPA